PGRVGIEFQGYRIDTSVGVLLLAILLLVAAVLYGYRAWRFVRRAPAQLVEARREGKRMRGYKALTQGLVAVAAGDAGAAGRNAKRANQLLNDPPLTMLLSAQVAQIEGDEAAAKKYFAAMLEQPEMEFLGLRGLLMQATREGDSTAALDYARRAYKLRPQTPWVLTTLFDLQVRAGQWDEAEGTLDEAIRRRAISADEGRRDRVVTLYERSVIAEAAGDKAKALQLAKKAHEQAPDFVPAAVRLAALHRRDDSPRRAAKAIEETWRRRPHPALAAAYRELRAPADAMAWLKDVQKLVAGNANHADSHLALAEAALDARLWGQARSHLEVALAERQSARACYLRAQLEEAEKGDAAAVREWLARAATAEPDPAYVCESCGAVSADWHPHCPRCHGFDSLEWRAPDHAVEVIGAPAFAALPAISAPDPKPAGRADKAAKEAIAGPPVAIDRPEDEDDEKAGTPGAAEPQDDDKPSDEDKPPPTVDAARRQV
ncbi:MAG: tetratricopeptide repeat protein, partial [Rhodospirillaceae bacterium]|nr:tetratricopeptide repeat protein [Rhodospirillaceae bacterium]